MQAIQTCLPYHMLNVRMSCNSIKPAETFHSTIMCMMNMHFTDETYLISQSSPTINPVLPITLRCHLHQLLLRFVLNPANGREKTELSRREVIGPCRNGPSCSFPSCTILSSCSLVFGIFFLSFFLAQNYVG